MSEREWRWKEDQPSLGFKFETKGGRGGHLEGISLEAWSRSGSMPITIICRAVATRETLTLLNLET